MPGQKLIDIAPGEAMTSGVFMETENEEVPVFAYGENVYLDNAGVSRYIGATQLDIVSQNIQAIVQNAAPGPQAIVFGSTAVWLWNGSPISLIGNVFSTPGNVSAETWGNWVLATNNVDKVKVWKNTGAFADLAGTNFNKCLQLIRRQPFMFAICPDGDPTKVSWCTTSNPEVWTPSATNQAGDFNIRDIPGAIIGACNLGDTLAIYSRESITVATYIGGTFLWSFNTQLRGVGIYSPRSVCSVDRLNFGLGPQGPFRTDGYSFQLLGTDDLRRWIAKNLDTTKPWEVIVFHNELLQSVEFHWTSKDGLPRRMIYKLSADKFMPVNLPLNAVAERDVFDYALVGIGNKLCKLEDALTWAGQEVLGRLHTKHLDASTSDMNKLFDTILLRGRLEGLNLAVDITEFDPFAGTENVSQVLSEPAQRLHYFEREGQKLRLRFEGTGRWHLSRAEIYGEQGGQIV